ncbi:hypothetical protein OBA28_02680 [Alphaproteobacteria bacterium]|nr:hypothetical protein [Alphaproteobacteria bacterium]
MNSEGDVCIISKTIHTKRNHSTVSFVWCGWELLVENSDVNFTFDLITRSSSLNHQYYLEYQTLIYDIISDKLDMGMDIPPSEGRDSETHALIP